VAPTASSVTNRENATVAAATIPTHTAPPQKTALVSDSVTRTHLYPENFWRGCCFHCRLFVYLFLGRISQKVMGIGPIFMKPGEDYGPDILEVISVHILLNILSHL